MPNNEEPVSMRVARLPLPRLPLLLPVGLSTALAPVRHPTPSTSLANDTHWPRGNGMPPPGPNRRGNMCITHTDPLRGYGFQGACQK
jgi:hypothetical protein